MNKIPIIVGVTGHRDIFIQEKQHIQKQFRRFLDLLQKEHPDTEIIVLSGLALGADIFAVEAAKENIDGKYYDYISLLPMDREEYIKDFRSLEEINPVKEYTFLDKNYTSGVELFTTVCNQSKVIHEGPYYTQGIYDERNQYYSDLGRRIAEYSDYLVAFYDNREEINGDEIKIGGTRDVIRMRREGVVNPNGKEFFLADNSQAEGVLIIPASRYYSGGEFKESNSLVEVTDDKMLEVINSIDDTKFYNQYNKESKTVLKEIEDSSILSMSELDITEEEKITLEYYKNVFITTDMLSIDYKKKMKKEVTFLAIVILIGILTFEFYGIWDETILLVVYLFSFIYAVWLNRKKSIKMKSHRKFVDYRLLAELLRIQFFWKVGGLQDNIFDEFPLKSRVIIKWLKKAMQSMELVTPQKEKNTIDQKRIEFILDKLIIDQKNFYKGKAEDHKEIIANKEKCSKRLYRIGFLAIVMSIVTSQFLNFKFSEFTVLILVAFSGMIIAIATLWSDRINVFSYDDLEERYKMMYKAYNKAEELLKNDKNLDNQKIIHEIGVEAINEFSDWYFYQRKNDGKLI